MFHGTSLTSVWKPTKTQFEPYDLCMNGSSHKQKICLKIHALRSNSDFSNNRKPAKKDTSNPKTIDMTELSTYSFIISSVWLLYLFSCSELEEEFPSLNDGQLCPLVTTTSKSQETSTVRWQSWKNVLFLETPGRNWIMSHDVQPSHHHLSHLSSSI